MLCQVSDCLRRYAGIRLVGIIFGVKQMTEGVAPALRARFFHGLADPSRTAILDALRTGERTAGDVASAAGITASNASRHLACLRDCGLLEARQDWRYVYYRLAPDVLDLLTVTDHFIGRVAERVAACTRPEMRPPDEQ